MQKAKNELFFFAFQQKTKQKNTGKNTENKKTVQTMKSEKLSINAEDAANHWRPRWSFKTLEDHVIALLVVTCRPSHFLRRNQESAPQKKRRGCVEYIGISWECRIIGRMAGRMAILTRILINAPHLTSARKKAPKFQHFWKWLEKECHLGTHRRGHGDSCAHFCLIWRINNKCCASALLTFDSSHPSKGGMCVLQNCSNNHGSTGQLNPQLSTREGKVGRRAPSSWK